MTIPSTARNPDRRIMLAHYKAWASDLIFNDVAGLPDIELLRERPTTFKNILGTLNHIYVVDDIFRAHLEGRSHPYTWRNTDILPGLGELRETQRAMDDWFISWATDLSEADWREVIPFEFVGGGEGAMTREEILLHLVNHGTYHRGFVSDMMYQVPAVPAANDLPVFLRDVWNKRP